jgi:hypothetical protein
VYIDVSKTILFFISLTTIPDIQDILRHSKVDIKDRQGAKFGPKWNNTIFQMPDVGKLLGD